MKSLTIILIASCLALFCVGYLFVDRYELNKSLQIRQSEINALREANQFQADSLNNVLKLQSDSLRVAKNTILLMHEASVKAEQKAKQDRKRFEQVVFIKYENDSLRTQAIQKLYPSFKTP